MSRVAKKPISIPGGVEVKLDRQTVRVTGAKGSLTHKIPEAVEMKLIENALNFAARKQSKNSSALAGTTRALLNNMVNGVSQGFEKRLNLIGVGYRAEAQGKKLLKLTLGFSQPINFDIPEGIQIETPAPVEIIVKGIDKQLVGQVAANIRAYRPPEPYKGKGIRYAGEIIVQKEAKKK
ncbi:MAG: 50S ribosomal protein L6 [Gammaproteobacteria bacterium]|nr:50S ribosomal protein L6 [Gammaproteobacteria bacterium]